MTRANDVSVRGVEALLRPRSIAVIGASATRRGSGNSALDNLQASTWDAELHVVHPSAKAIGAVPAVPAVSDLPLGLDAALVSLPAVSVIPVLEALEAQGCRAALVPSASFSVDLKHRLARFVATSSMAVHGPNCMGIVNVTDDVPAWFYDDILTSHARGGAALVSQSGAAAFATRGADGVGFSKIISTGDEIGLTTADYLRWLAEDPETTAVGVIMESIKDVPDFVDAIRCLRQAGKPAVALKVGRTDLGSAATRAHTGAVTGKDAAYAALFDRLDLPMVADYDELVSALACLAVPDMPRAAGVRVGVVTDSGGEAGLAADLSGRQRVVLPSFSRRTAERLESAHPGATVNNPFDAGASVTAEDTRYDDAYSLIAADEHVDSLMVVVEAHHNMTQGETDYAIDHCRAMRELGEAGIGKPVIAVSSSSTATSEVFRSRLGPRVPLVRGISNGFAALRAIAGNRRPVPSEPVRPARLPSPDQVRALRVELAGQEGVVDAALAHRILDTYGLPMTAATVVQTAREAVDWAQGRYPVVVKVASPDVAHRSELGGVVLDVDGDAALADAIARIHGNVTAAAPSASLTGYEIQQQVPGGVEAMLGFTADPVFGATVGVGTGGTLVELDADAAVSLAPLTFDETIALISRTKLGKVLDGYRNLLPNTDLRALGEALESLSWLAADLAGVIQECDLNPAIVEPGTGVVTIVDVLLVTRADTEAPGTETPDASRTPAAAPPAFAKEG